MKQPWFELLVLQAEKPPARRLFQGYSIDCAMEEAQRQYPKAEICIPEQAMKVVLTRSRNGPKKTFREIQARRRQHESRS